MRSSIALALPLLVTSSVPASSRLRVICSRIERVMLCTFSGMEMTLRSSLGASVSSFWFTFWMISSTMPLSGISSIVIEAASWGIWTSPSSSSFSSKSSENELLFVFILRFALVGGADGMSM